MKDNTELTSNIIDFPPVSQTLVIGTNGTGKTTFIKSWISEELKKENSKILIVVPDNFVDFENIECIEKQSIDSFLGVRKIIYSPDLLKTITREFKNGTVIFSDCRAYLHRLNENFLYFLVHRRRISVNSVFVFHDFAAALPGTLIFATHFVIFKTTRQRRNLNQYVSSSKQVSLAINKVNTNAKTQPHYFKIVKNGSRLTSLRYTSQYIASVEVKVEELINAK